MNAGFRRCIKCGEPIFGLFADIVCDDCRKKDTVSRFKEFEPYQKDNINPDHYKNQTSLECIEAMEIMFGEDAILKFCLCNAYKYIWRHKNKNGKEDLNKARWYLNRASNIITYYDGDAESDERIMIRRIEKYIVDHLKEESDG